LPVWRLFRNPEIGSGFNSGGGDASTASGDKFPLAFRAQSVFHHARLRSAACLEKLLSAAFPKSQIGNRKSKFFNA